MISLQPKLRAVSTLAVILLHYSGRILLPLHYETLSLLFGIKTLSCIQLKIASNLVEIVTRLLLLTRQSVYSVHYLLPPFAFPFIFEDTLLCIVICNYHCWKTTVVSLNLIEMAGDVSLIDIIRH